MSNKLTLKEAYNLVQKQAKEFEEKLNKFYEEEAKRNAIPNDYTELRKTISDLLKDVDHYREQFGKDYFFGRVDALNEVLTIIEQLDG